MKKNKWEVKQGGGHLEKFRENFNITQKIIDLYFNDANKLILKLETETEVPIITFETFKNYYGELAVESKIRELFNNSTIDRKLEMCNARLEDLTQ